MGRVKANIQFPFVNLEKAIARAKQLYDADQRGNEMSAATAFAVWKYSEKSSGGFQTISGLKMYGLLEDGGHGKVRLTKHAIEFFRDEREDYRSQKLMDFATNPPLLMDLFNYWGSHVPSDTVARSHLKIDRGLSEQSSRAILGIFKENIAFANVKADARVAEIKDGKGAVKNTPAVKVGDYIQWTCNSVDQFKPVRKVTKIEGDHLWVHGSMTGIPMNEVTVTDAPRPSPAGIAAAGSESDISVLQAGKRLQITADVDASGLANLQEMLGKYAEILKILK